MCIETVAGDRARVIERLELVQAVVAVIALGLGVWMLRGEQKKV